ncbi:MAG: hypothetical protein COV29_02915 [Candidatus Yanofskybacteria bacterium CG10_big_fil_rev_8_21_14_0_10_36_16]|uniref:Uncharacterized protein n=1 Tax=Candidatus Yanofskybacteria bacterium CG10_big_fil_rev_8_21_14_0_10_36_16 TaxID=1975096 RepID=A0A2J0Q6Y9_9BACT|nr:MAG: hypothetical protein COV29_02915 [Candidatus Yanofskybacteria bacterium CG10_big_fil_rev_8_21_14_0_10_36_16]
MAQSRHDRVPIQVWDGTTGLTEPTSVLSPKTGSELSLDSWELGSAPVLESAGGQTLCFGLDHLLHPIDFGLFRKTDGCGVWPLWV